MGTVKQNLGKRVKKARMAVTFAAIVKRNRLNQPTVVRLPATKGTHNEVIIGRSGNLMTTECRKDIGRGFDYCKGQAQTVCYHAMAAIIVVAAEAGYDVRFTANKEDAINLTNLGGKFFEIRPSHKRYDPATAVFAVVFSKGEK